MTGLPDYATGRKHNQKTSKARFVFHEQVLRDQRNLTKYALALAGFIMHEPNTADGVSFRISLRRAERYLGIKRSMLQTARNLLAERGHIVPMAEKTGVKGRRDQAGLYFFGEGPAAPVIGTALPQGPLDLKTTLKRG